MGPCIYWKCWTYAFNLQQRPLDVYLINPMRPATLDWTMVGAIKLLKSRVVERGRAISTPLSAEEKAKRHQALTSPVAT